MPALERNLQKTVLHRLKKLRLADPRLLFRKKHGTAMGVAGDPDVYGVWAGIPFAMELKRPGEYPTALQEARLREWGLAGAVIGVIHSLAEFQAMMLAIETSVGAQRSFAPIATPTQNSPEKSST